MNKIIAIALALWALVAASASLAQETERVSVDSFRYAYVYDRTTYDDPEAEVRFAVLQTPVLLPVSDLDRFLAFHRETGVDVIVICRLIARNDGSFETLRSQGRPIGCTEYR